MIDAEGSIADARQRVVRQRVFKEKPFKAMHVCFATDVQVDKLRNEKPWLPSHYYKEHILFSIKMYNDGLLEMGPAFSRTLEEDETRAHVQSTGSAPNVFLTNKTIAAGIKKGMKLQTYRLRSDDGSEYEYTIENMHDYTLPSQVETAHSMSIMNDAYTSQAVRGEGVWKMDPPAEGRDQTMAYYSEIVSATGFDGEQLFITYHVTSPPDWNLRTGDLIDGMNEESLKGLAKMGNKAMRALATSAMDMDGYDDGEAARGAMQGATQIAHSRATRGGITLPNLRPFWKGRHLPYSFDGLSRFIWGCSFFLLTVISVVCGIEYPFWLIPCLIFTFGVGTGYPGGPTQVCLKSSVKGCSSSHSAAKMLVGDPITQPIAVFNHLISLSFDRKLQSPTEFTAMPSASSPTIVFQVYSVGMFGRVSLQGYGYSHLPTAAGSIDVVVKTWKPLGGIQSQMTDFFLGSSVRLSDPNFVDISLDTKYQTRSVGSGINPKARHTTVLNRFGVRSETSGEIRFRCHVISVTPSKALQRDTSNAFTTTRGRTVDDILKVSRSTGRLGMSVLSASASGSTLGLGGLGRFTLNSTIGSAGLEMSMRTSARESDSASLSKRAEQLLAQARSKVSGLGAIASALTSSMSGSKDDKFSRADSKASESRNTMQFPLSDFAENKSDARTGLTSLDSKRSAPRYDNDDESASLLDR